MNVYISPCPTEYCEDGTGSGGIWRIINAMARWLPEYGVNVVSEPAQADIVHIHAGAMVDTDTPIVQSLHGYYWTGDFQWAPEYWQYNSMVIEVSRRADAILSPSEWVAQPVRRDLRKSPYIIPHGIEPCLPLSDPQGYVLWGKPRVDVVCNPEAVNLLAARAPGIPFVTTFGRPAGNVRVIGAQPYNEFMKTMSGASVWLATARETGDIASREAMLMGIPVLGWNHGATAELVQHKRCGYLAKVDDYDDLLDGLHFCLENRDELGKNARDYVVRNFSWKDIIGRYVAVYRDVLNANEYPVDISVVIPSYNYAHFLQESLDSVASQAIKDARVEVIVVDDCSSDNTQSVIRDNDWVRNIRHPENRGLPAALNTGHEAARGKYIINLDADNLLAPDALSLMYDVLENKPWIDVASGSIAIYSDSGNHNRATDWPFGTVAPLAQLNHINQLPSSSMMRSSSIKRLGGYRHRQRKNEDGEFWCRAISAGLWLEQVTREPVLVYRWHENNKSKLEGGEDDPEGTLSWNYYYPWAKTLSIMPFASTCRPPRGSWPVRSYANPHICVVIPCGPGHDLFLPDALDSVIGQTFQNFECVVANDTGHPIDVAAMGHPWVRVVDTEGRVGPAVARNTAIHHARAPLIVPLDADDMLYRDALETMYAAWLENSGSLVYMDCDTEDLPGRRQRYYSGPFSMEKLLTQAIYQDTCLFAKEWWRIVGGYPTDQPHGLWEDWLFPVKIHLMGIDATYVNKPWGVYRHWTALEDGASKNDSDNADYGTDKFKEKLEEVQIWIKEKMNMPCRGCGGGARASTKPATANLPFAVDLSGPDLNAVYDGPREGSFTVNTSRGPLRVRKGYPFKISPEDAFVATLPGFHLITQQEVAAPAFPEEAPVVMMPDVPAEPPPAISEAKIVLPDDLHELPISASKVEALKEAGLLTKEDVWLAIEAGGDRILSISGFGDATLRRLAGAFN